MATTYTKIAYSIGERLGDSLKKIESEPLPPQLADLLDRLSRVEPKPSRIDAGETPRSTR